MQRMKKYWNFEKHKEKISQKIIDTPR